VKKIDKLVATSFIGPYFLSFFVAEFVLIMQFLWKYIDDILGKGFSMFDLMELIFYYAVTIIPMAVPITILIASVMVFGDMSEKFELSSMKSAGISLIRIMGAGIVIACFTALFSIFASNYLKPLANYQFQKKFIAIKRQKSALAIEEKVFNDDFKSFVIRVDEVEKNGVDIKDVILYDQTQQDKSLINMIRSKSGQMYNSEDGNFFIMALHDGNQYRELEPERGKPNKYSLLRTEFEDYTKIFDMSEFDLNENSLDINRNKEDMLNTFQLIEAIDSIDQRILKTTSDLQDNFDDILSRDTNIKNQENQEDENSDFVKTLENKEPPKFSKKISNVTKKLSPKKVTITLPKLYQVSEDSIKSSTNLYDSFRGTELSRIMTRAIAKASAQRDKIQSNIHQEKEFEKNKQKYILRLNQQYSWALICIIFLFIGAPLGSIIRKGGYGYPLLVAIIFYMTFIISSIMGEKMLKSESISGAMGAWIPCLILLPFAIYLTTQALRDAKLTDLKIKFWK